MLSPGERAPNVRGTDQHGHPFALQEALASGPVVLYFYPADFTPVCTAEACHFRDAFEDLRGLGATVVGVSKDDESTHARFAAKHALTFSLLADPDRRIIRDYGVDVLGLGLRTRRVTYVIATDGRIAGAFSHELSARAHVDDVRRLLETLKKTKS